MTLKKAERRDDCALVRRALGLAAIAVTLMGAANSHAASSDDEKAVAQLDIEYQAAVKNNDAETMDRILSDDFILVTGLGKTYTKADIIAEARSKKTSYERQEDSSRTMRVWGDAVVVTALLWVKGSEDGKPFDYRLWFSDVYLRTSSGWRYVFAQASTRLPAKD